MLSSVVQFSPSGLPATFSLREKELAVNKNESEKTFCFSRYPLLSLLSLLKKAFLCDLCDLCDSVVKFTRFSLFKSPLPPAHLSGYLPYHQR